MRELHGVIDPCGSGLQTLKHPALIFDKFHLMPNSALGLPGFPEADGQIRAEIDFLLDCGRMDAISANNIEAASAMAMPEFDGELDALRKRAFELVGSKVPFIPTNEPPLPVTLKYKLILRHYSTFLSRKLDAEFVPILHDIDALAVWETAITAPEQKVFCVALSGFPVPNDMCAWQDIFDFKEELHDKQWAFRRFLHSLVTKKQCAAEIRDDIEWSVNEYSKAMRLHNIKANVGVIDAYVVPVLEIIENFAKFNWSKIAKGALSVTKQKSLLMETEMKAPGRECAYVFDARKRFAS